MLERGDHQADAGRDTVCDRKPVCHSDLIGGHPEMGARVGGQPQVRTGERIRSPELVVSHRADDSPPLARDGQDLGARRHQSRTIPNSNGVGWY